jgi:hypothetical protein
LRESRAAFSTTDTDDAAMAAPATAGVSRPKAANGMPMALKANSARGPRDADGFGNEPQIRSAEREACCGAGRLCALPHGNADAGSRQCWCIVKAVPNHHDHALCRHVTDRTHLIRWFQTRAHIADA